MEIAVKLTVDMLGSLDLVAAKRTLQVRIGDDLTMGGSPDEIQRFIGDRDESLQCSGPLPRILSRAGLQLKAIVVPREPDGIKLVKLGAAALGEEWNTRLTF